MKVFQKPETIDVSVTIASRPELQKALSKEDELDGAILLRNQWSDMRSYNWKFDSDAVTLSQGRDIKLEVTSATVDAGEYHLVVKVDSGDTMYVLPKDPEAVVIREGII